jgi:hypothetical protein
MSLLLSKLRPTIAYLCTDLGATKRKSALSIDPPSATPSARMVGFAATDPPHAATGAADVGEGRDERAAAQGHQSEPCSAATRSFPGVPGRWREPGRRSPPAPGLRTPALHVRRYIN